MGEINPSPITANQDFYSGIFTSFQDFYNAKNTCFQAFWGSEEFGQKLGFIL